MTTLPTLEHLTSLIQNAGISIITTDLVGNITSFNKASENLYHYSATDAIGQPATLLIPAYRRAENERAVRAVLAEGRTIHSDTENITRSGDTFAVHAVFSPIQDASGTIIGVSRFSVDISRRLTLQNSLQKERDLLEAIQEATTDALMMVDNAGIVVTANQQFEASFHLPRHQFVTRPVHALTELIHRRDDLPNELINLVLMYSRDAYQSDGGDFELEAPERRVFVWYTAPVHGHDGTSLGRLFVFRDATREREVDRMKTEFVSLVSHELRTPLTSIRGFADLILDGEAGAIPTNVREYVDIIKLNAERLASLVSNILDLSRIESGRIDLVRENFQPVAFIEPAAASLRPMVESRQQKFIVKIAPDLPAVWVDRDRMVQIIINLLANATKYTDRYGTLTLEARLLQNGDPMPPGAPTNVRLPVVLVGVHDTGIGISAHDRAMVFERFYRTNEAARQQIAGSGLGLTIVRSFVELHGGQVWIDSEVGRGSSFYFTIPLAEGC